MIRYTATVECDRCLKEISRHQPGDVYASQSPGSTVVIFDVEANPAADYLDYCETCHA